ncbi:MAG: DUF11 domain-containing protein, partial [Bacteroidota bacterium]|nr:DUF11 domain-containing protein [Bacteroidota bacterium]
PSLLINKTVDKVSAAPGDTLTYSLTISNGSLISSTSTTMVDTIPSNTSFVSATGGGTLSGGRITWNLGTLAANANSTVTFKVKASSPLSNGTKISNIAYATTNKLTDTVSSNTAQTTIQSSPTLTLTKSVNNGTSTPGSTLTYTLTYGNTGNSDATSFSLTDNIPSNTSYVLGSVTGTGASYDITGNRIVVYRSTLTAGTTNQTVTFQVRIASPLLAGTYTITNSATAAASNASSATASATTTVTATPTITISKTAPTISYLHGSPTARDTVTFTISYSITGKAIVDSEYVNDVLPSGLTYLSSSPSATSVSGQTVKWSLGTSTPDTSGELTVTAWTATAGTYTNSAKLTSSYSPSGTTSDTTSTQIVNTVTGTIGQNSPITPGGTVTVTVNDADLKGDGVIFIETKNTRTGETENLGLQETGTNTGIFTGTVSTTFGTSAGTNNNGIFNVQANDSIRGRYIDQYNASGATDTVYAYTQVSGGYTATISANPTLIAADDSSTFTLTDHDLNKNSSLVESYTLTVKNSTGETEAMIFTETGANTGIFTKKVPTVYGTPPGTNNDGHFTVQAGDTISVSYLDSLTATGDTATISAFFRIGTVDYSTSSKSVQDLNGGQVQPPDTLQYTIKIKNSGTASAKAITVKDTLPSGVTVLASTISNSGSASGQVITWSFSTITNGDSLTLTYQVYVDSSIQSNVAAVNRAHIVSSGVDQLDTASFTPVNRPLMTMTKSVSSTSGRMRPGDTLVYTINYKNTGTATATYVSVSDPNPNNTTYVLNSVTLNAVPKTDVADGDEVTVSSNTITVSVGTVTPGQTGVITFRVRIQ